MTYNWRTRLQSGIMGTVMLVRNLGNEHLSLTLERESFPPLKKYIAEAKF